MGVVGILHKCSNAHVSGIDKNTKEKMVSPATLVLQILSADSDKHSNCP